MSVDERVLDGWATFTRRPSTRVVLLFLLLQPFGPTTDTRTPLNETSAVFYALRKPTLPRLGRSASTLEAHAA